MFFLLSSTMTFEVRCPRAENTMYSPQDRTLDLKKPTIK